MIIQLKDNLSIKDIQSDFEKKFPFLKLLFFKHPHSEKEGSSKKDLLSGALKLPVSSSTNKDKITFDENITVIELENLFKEHFKLNAQVFRKSGNNWIETTVTDNWTLKKQNEQGKELSELRF